MAIDGLKVDFSELERLNPFFKDQEKIINNTVLNSFMKGAAVARKELKNNTPPALAKFNETLQTKKLKPKDGILQVMVGYFGRKVNYVNRRGVKWDAYFMLYWANYGTLSKRASDHPFQFGRKKVSADHKGGISPLKFFDKAADSVMDTAFAAIDQAAEKELYKQVAKHGFKS
jgi:hypothetical protein